ncbi:MAG: cell shape determination protein CcmA [Epsilonproteobacteria bacterium]|nr:cell shape determination protein CcmA [Campylobacterota bacterium]NPA64083.1 cell shape determination protein CcmA [Campylobacterota bacterium]
MGIFGKSAHNHPVSKETTVISAQARVVGEFELDSNLHIDGEVEGKVTSTKAVSIGKSGKFRGEISAAKVVISGMVLGSIDCDVAEILSGGRVVGDVCAKKFIIQESGVFDGVCKHKEEAKPQEPQQIELKES